MATNTTSEERSAGPWQRLMLQQLTTVAGLVIALTAATAIMAGEGRTNHQSAALRPEPATLWTSQPVQKQPEHVVYYLVNSEDEAEQVRTWAWYEKALLAGDLGYRKTAYIPLIRTAPEDVYGSEAYASASDHTGNTFQVVDLRKR